MKPASRSRRWAVFFSLVIPLAGLAPCASQVCAQVEKTNSTEEVRSAESTMRVEFLRERVTVIANDIPAEELLLEIALRCGLDVIIDGPLGERVSLQLNGVSLPEAVRQVLGDIDFSLVYSKPDRSTAYALPGKRGKLWVFTPGSGKGANSSENAPAASLAEQVTVNEDSIDQVAGGPRTRVAAVRSLDSVPAYEALHHLNAALADDDASAREEAVLGLADLGVEESAMALTAAPNDENEWVREAVVGGLAQIGSQDSQRLLAPALVDGDPALREIAVEALAEVGGTSSIEKLKQVLGDEDDGVRATAFRELADLGGDESFHALAMGLHDPNASIREEVVVALAGIGGEKSMQLLQRALADTDENVREAAQKYLVETATGLP